MHQCAYDHQDEYPIGALAVLNSFYVDDALTGADSLEEAITLRDQMIEILSKRKFELSKWCSNNPFLSQKNNSEFVEIQDTETKSILGLGWIPQSDCWTFRPDIDKVTNNLTKRKILS